MRKERSNMKSCWVYGAAIIAVVDMGLVMGGESQETPRKLASLTEDGRNAFIKHLKSRLETIDLATVSYILTKDKRRTVILGASGTIKIVVGDVKEELLRTEISLVSFQPVERYNARDAIVRILQTKEVEGKIRKLGVEHPVIALTGIRQGPDPRLPHLPVSLRNVSMEEALDRVAETFGGVLIYGEWIQDGTRFFDVDFAGMAEFGHFSNATSE